MNIAVINLKDLIKYIACFIVILVIISIAINFVKKEGLNENQAEGSLIYNIKNSSFLYCLKMELSIFDMNNNSEENKSSITNTSKEILGRELAIIESIETSEIINDESTYEEDENIASNLEETEEDLNLENLETEIIEENNINPSYTNEGSNVQINNQTEYDITDIINDSTYEITNKTKFIIYHTHTCESYTSSDEYQYEMTGNYRTTDLNFTVSRVGDELAKYLEEYGKTVIHDKTYHDYPAYNGSYGRSLTTVQSILESNQDAEIIIDLHRDAVGSSNTYAPTVKIGDDICAQVMFVIGTDSSGLYHPNWRQNLSFAIKVQEKANELYPRTF